MKKKLKRRIKSLKQKSKNIVELIDVVHEEKIVDFIGSGSTRLNLALSGNEYNGWARRRICNIVGDGSSGKTLLALEAAFWCFNNIKKINPKGIKKPVHVSIVYDNAEGVMDFPLVKMYGQEFVDFIEWESSRTIEDMGRNYTLRLNNLKSKHFLLYIIDSWDALSSYEGTKRFEESVKKNQEMGGSYNLEKQLFASKFFSHICGKMNQPKKDATLMIISQVRVKIGATFGKKTYRAGGKALDFYTHQVAWIRELEKMRKTKQGEKRVYGIRSHVKIERNKVAKPFRESEFTILYDYGMDDLSSIIDYVFSKNNIEFEGNKFNSKQKLIRYIERNNLEKKIIEKAAKKWKDVEESFSQEVRKRKSRYTNLVN